MRTSLLVPFRFGAEQARDRAWKYVRHWYTAQHPGMDVVVGSCGHDEPWSKGAATRRAFRRSHGQVLVIADADVIVRPEALEKCVQLVAAGAVPWAQPHDRVFRLSERMTNAIIGREELPSIIALGNQGLERRMHPAPAGGGIVVLSAEAFDAVGGIDPGFVGWGGDDISFARALDTLVGPCRRLTSPLWHLWHLRAPRREGNRASEQSEHLAARYLVASGNVGLMRALIDEAR